ncbi:MAG TPA: NHL repeat-containing protein, partial [Armatimonadota bacterium]
MLVSLILPVIEAPSSAGQSGTWRVVAMPGEGAGQVVSPRGVAIDPSGALFIADAATSTVQRRDPDGDWTVLAHRGFLPGSLLAPVAVAADGKGNLYVAESADGNNRVQRRTLDGAWTIVAAPGSGIGQVDDPTGLAVSSDGDLFVSERGSSRVQRRTPQGAWVVIASRGTGQGEVDRPESVALDASDNLYVAEGTRVQKRSTLGKWSTAVDGASIFPMACHFSAVAVDELGDLYTADTANDQLCRWEGQLWLLPMAFRGGDPGSVNGPVGLACGPRGTLCVSESGNYRVQQYTPPADHRPRSLEQGFTVQADAANDVLLYAADTEDALISIEAATQPAHGELEMRANGSAVYSPDRGFVGTDGFTFCARDRWGEPGEPASVTIRVVASPVGDSLGAWSTVAPSGDGLGQVNWVMSVAASPEGDLLVASYSSPMVQRRDRSGAWTDLSTLWEYSTGVAVGADGTLYVSAYDTASQAYKVVAESPSGSRREL